MKKRIQNYLIFSAFLVLLTSVVGFGCTKEKVKPFLDGFYGSQARTYIVDNSYDESTSVKIVAVWDEEGKVKLSSSLIPKTGETTNSPIRIDVPEGALEFQDANLLLRPSNLTIGIYYDEKAILHINNIGQAYPAFCCYSNNGCPPGGGPGCAFRYSTNTGWECNGGRCCYVGSCDQLKTAHQYALVLQASDVEIK